VAVEVIGERPDNQQSSDQQSGARWRLRTIGYKAEDDVIEIAVRGCSTHGHLALRHFIAGPRAITVLEHEPPDLTTMVVDDASGTRTRIRLFAGPVSPEEPPPSSRCAGARRVIGAGRVGGPPIVGLPARARSQARGRVRRKPTDRMFLPRETRRRQTISCVHRPRRFS